MMFWLASVKSVCPFCPAPRSLGLGAANGLDLSGSRVLPDGPGPREASPLGFSTPVDGVGYLCFAVTTGSVGAERAQSHKGAYTSRSLSSDLD